MRKIISIFMAAVICIAAFSFSTLARAPVEGEKSVAATVGTSAARRAIEDVQFEQSAFVASDYAAAAALSAEHQRTILILGNVAVVIENGTRKVWKPLELNIERQTVFYDLPPNDFYSGVSFANRTRDATDFVI